MRARDTPMSSTVRVLGAALDDVAGLVGVVPGVGQVLDVVEQGVPHPSHRALAGPGQVHAGGVVGQARQRREGQGGPGADDDVAAQHVPAADGFDPPHQEPGEVEGGVVDDGVHRDPDDLGGHVVCHHRHHHHEKRQDELQPEPLGVGEKPQDIGLFRLLFHGVPAPFPARRGQLASLYHGSGEKSMGRSQVALRAVYPARPGWEFFKGGLSPL